MHILAIGQEETQRVWAVRISCCSKRQHFPIQYHRYPWWFSCYRWWVNPGSAGGENSYWGNALVLRDSRQQRFPNRSRSCSCWRFPGQSCLYLFWLWPPVVQILGCLGSTDVDCDSGVFFVSFKPLYLSFVQSRVLRFPYRKPQLGDQLGFTILRVNFPLALANRISDG